MSSPSAVVRPDTNSHVGSRRIRRTSDPPDGRMVVVSFAKRPNHAKIPCRNQRVGTPGHIHVQRIEGGDPKRHPFGSKHGPSAPPLMGIGGLGFFSRVLQDGPLLVHTFGTGTRNWGA